MGNKVISVGCRLPHGIVINHPANPSVTVTLKGQNSNRIIGSDGNAVNGSYGVTEVDAEFWADWIKANAKFAPVVAGAIFADEKPAELEAKAKEAKQRKTGLEPLEKSGDERAAGVSVAE